MCIYNNYLKGGDQSTLKKIIDLNLLELLCYLIQSDYISNRVIIICLCLILRLIKIEDDEYKNKLILQFGNLNLKTVLESIYDNSKEKNTLELVTVLLNHVNNISHICDINIDMY